MAQTLPLPFDFHFLLFAPSLDAWVFTAAERYWTTFRSILYSMRSPEDVTLVTHVTDDNRVIVVTLAMRRDTAPSIQANAARLLPGVQLDPLVYDTAADLKLTLDGRANLNQRFGTTTGTPAVRPTRTPGPVLVP